MNPLTGVASVGIVRISEAGASEVIVWTSVALERPIPKTIRFGTGLFELAQKSPWMANLLITVYPIWAASISKSGLGVNVDIAIVTVFFRIPSASLQVS